MIKSKSNALIPSLLQGDVKYRPVFCRSGHAIQFF